MIKTRNKFKHSIIVTFLLALTLSTILLFTPLNPNTSDNLINNEKEDFESILPLLNNGIGEDPWWNVSFQWRQCINITNSGTFDLEDNIIKIQFNWKNLYDAGHLQDDLDDIRIVENNVIRRYHIKQDFPSTDLATVWFEVNSTAGTADYDTFLYYGNNSVGRATNYYMDHCPDGIARWEFEEGSGNRVYDSMSNLYHGTMYNMEDVDFVATPELEGDYAISMDGVNEYIALNMSFNYQGADPDYVLTTFTGPIYQFTASAWVKISLNQGGWSILDFDRSEYFTFAAGEPGYRATDGHVEFDCANDAGGIDDFTGLTLIDEDVPAEWHHCVITFDYTQQFDKRIYVDGLFDNQKDAWSGLPIGDISEARFGFIGDGSEATTFNGGRNGQYFQGMLDDVRYFDYALSDNEIEWLANYYPLDIELLQEVERAATVTINIKDEDDRLVPGAEVTLWENNTHILTIDNATYTQYTLSDGSVEFSQVPFGSYNISVNYTLYNGLDEKIVYDSRSAPGGEVEFEGLFVLTNITVNLWTIDFEVDDSDGDPLNYGYVDVGNSSIPVIDTIPLDSNGEATFRWLSTSSYNYTIYYDNPDYYTHPTPLHSASVSNLVPPQIYYEYVAVNMAKLDIRIMDNTGTESVTGVKVKVQLNNTSQDVVEMETDTSGYAHGAYTTDFGFWYLNGQAYNFTLWIVNQPQTFIVNTSDKAKPGSITPYYNYSLTQAALLVFYLDLNFTQRLANFTNIQGATSVEWGQNISYSVVYETSDDSGQSWLGDWNRDGFSTSATWTIYSKFGVKLFEKPMSQALGPTGNFTISVNSSILSAGYESEFYYIYISGYKPFWNDPSKVYFGLTLFAKPTELTLHDYSSMPDELPKNVGGDYEISEYYGFTVNVTARYFDSGTGIALAPESFTYDWDYGSGSLSPGPLPGYYTFEIDTSDATNVGKYRIDLSVRLTNFTQFEDFGMYIEIISRPTEINGQSGILYVSENIFIFESMNFTFDYVDVFSSTPVINLDEKSYLLQKLDENGVPIPGTTETGSLVETPSQDFVLDLDTETRLDGEYSIIVTLDKLNYEHRIAIISLTINKRIFEYTLPSEFKGTKVEVDSGAPLRFTLTLTDPNNSSVPVIGATLYITFKATNYTFIDNLDGTYSIEIPKIADAFFVPSTFTAMLTIEKQYFSTVSTPLTIVVNMHETFGIPTFYLLMIIGAVVAVTASLVIYRTVQQARIPTFVKKARKMKKDIKSKKSISDSLLYPSKEEYMVKQLGDRWDMLGLSMRDILGIEGKKKKLLEPAEAFKESKGGVE
ncbi:MAG: LamG-like jellyroll fold domain-containing protein [Candidatus Hermodarchaeota archaeon]